MHHRRTRFAAAVAVALLLTGCTATGQSPQPSPSKPLFTPLPEQPMVAESSGTPQAGPQTSSQPGWCQVPLPAAWTKAREASLKHPSAAPTPDPGQWAVTFTPPSAGSKATHTVLHVARGRQRLEVTVPGQVVIEEHVATPTHLVLAPIMQEPGSPEIHWSTVLSVDTRTGAVRTIATTPKQAMYSNLAARGSTAVWVEWVAGEGAPARGTLHVLDTRTGIRQTHGTSVVSAAFYGDRLMLSSLTEPPSMLDPRTMMASALDPSLRPELDQTEMMLEPLGGDGFLASTSNGLYLVSRAGSSPLLVMPPDVAPGVSAAGDYAFVMGNAQESGESVGRVIDLRSRSWAEVPGSVAVTSSQGVPQLELTNLATNAESMMTLRGLPRLATC